MNNFICRLYKIARIKVPKDKGFDDKIYPYQIRENQGINEKVSIHELVTYIALCTKGAQDIEPSILQKRLKNKNAAEVSNIIMDLIEKGKQHNSIMVYNPWKPLQKWQTFPQSTLMELSTKINIRASALWGIYNSSKTDFPYYIDIVKQYMDHTGEPMPDTVSFNILSTNFNLGFQNIIDQLNITKGKFYKLLISNLANNNFNINDTIKQLMLSKSDTVYQKIVNKSFIINDQQHDVHTISQATGIDMNDLILFIILDNQSDSKLEYNHFISAITMIMGSGSNTIKSKNGHDMKVFSINGKQMTYYDIREALDITRATIYKYLREQGDNFPKFIEDLINQKIPTSQLYIQVGNESLSLNDIAELFNKQGKSVSRKTLSKRFNEILEKYNFNYKKAVTTFTKIINDELNSNKFSLNKIYNSSAIKIGHEIKTTTEWVQVIKDKWGKELITTQQIRNWKHYLQDDKKVAERIKDIIDHGGQAEMFKLKFPITVNNETLEAHQWAKRINDKHGYGTISPQTVRAWYTTGIEYNQPNFAAEKVQEKLLFGNIDKNVYHVFNKNLTFNELASKLSMDKNILINKWKELQGDYLRMESWLMQQFEDRNITAYSRLRRKIYAIKKEDI